MKSLWPAKECRNSGRGWIVEAGSFVFFLKKDYPCAVNDIQVPDFRPTAGQRKKCSLRGEPTLRLFL